MTMVQCAECGKSVSSIAAVCPHCGVSPVVAAPDRTVAKNLAWLVGITVVMWQCTSSSPSKIDGKTTHVDSTEAARGACMLFIADRLHDAGSAEFQPATRIDFNGDIWTVHRAVKAKNALGAYRLQSYECRIRQTGDKLDLVSLSALD